MSKNCITPEQIKEQVKGLEKKFGVDLGLLENLTEVEAIENYINSIKSLKNLRKKDPQKVEEIKAAAIDLLNQINSSTVEETSSSQPANKNKFYVSLKSGSKDKDSVKGFSQFDINEFAEMFNSAFISLYNSGSLLELLSKEEKISKVSGDFTNRNLANILKKFLLQVDESTKSQNYKRINSIKKVFRNEDTPFKNYEKDNATKLFYVEEVFPLMMDFLAMYYNEHFKPNIFTPQFINAKEGNAHRTIDELVRINPEFGLISKSKDILVGTHLAFLDLMTELNESDFSSEEKIDIINKSEFNKVANRLMDFFRYNDKSFGGMQDVNSDSINKENSTELDDESNKEVSNDEKITREGFTTSGNERSGFESASTETRAILSSLFDIDKDAIKTDIYGLPILLNEFVTFKKLSKILRGKIDYSEFYKILQDNKDELPFIEQLLLNYLPIDPSVDINEFFTNTKYNAQKRQYLQRVKQAFLQDLTKDRVEAKEINITVKRKWTKANKPYEVITTQVNDARQKKTVSIRKESTTRFHQKYFKNKEKVFGESLINDNQLIRLEAIIKAALKFEDLKNLNVKDQKLQDVLDVLAIFGITPSDNIKSRTSIKNLLNKSKGGATIEAFFEMLPMNSRQGFRDIFKSIDSVKVGDTVNKLQNNILKIVKGLNKENTDEIVKELNMANKFSALLKRLEINSKIKEETNYSIDATNEKIQKLFNNYLSNITDILNDKKNISASKLANLIKANTKELEDSINDELNSLTKKSLRSTLTKYKNEKITKFIDSTMLNLSDPMVQLKDVMDALYKEYYKLEEEYIIEDDGIIDFNKKPRHLIQSLNNLMIKANDLNNKNPKLLLRFPELDPTKNPLIASSILFNQFYNIDANGNITPKDQDKINVNINNILGISLKSQAVNSGGLSINNQYEQDNLLSSIILLLFNGNEESNNVDKEAAYNIQFKNIKHSDIFDTNEKISQVNDFLPIPSYIISDLFSSVIEESLDPINGTKKTSKSLTYASNKKAKKGIEPVANIFKNYLTHYLLMYYKIEKGDLQYVKKEYQNLGQNYKELGLFEKDSSKNSSNYIISAELKNKLKEVVGNLELDGLSLKDMTNRIENVIDEVTLNDGKNGYTQFKEDLIKHFQNQVEEAIEALKYSKNYEELDNIIKMFKGDATEKKNSKLPYANDFSRVTEETASKLSNIEDITPDNISMLKGLLMTYVINYQVLSQEKLLMFYGDPMFLKPSSYVKRASSPGSTGNYSLIDYWDIAYYNHPDNHSAFAFAKALNEKLIKEGEAGLEMSLHKLDFTYRYGQVEDNIIKSAVYNQLLDGFKESFKLRFGNKFTEEQIAEKAKQALNSYNKLNEADGYGVITLDWYKIFSELTNTWSQEQDDVYNALAAGETVPYSLLSVTFPVRKFQYTGSIFKDNKQIPADGLHKFSLAPILPGSDNNLQTKNENLIKEGKAYEIFSSANKKENLLNESGEKDYFYDGKDQSKRVIEKLQAKNVNGKMVYDSGKKSLYAITNLLKDQVHIDTEVKNKVILARQLKRVGKTDLFENGVPVDFKGTGTNKNDLKDQWNALSKSEKLEKSKIFSTYRGIVDNINDIISIEEKVILEKLGLEVVKVSDSQKTIRLLPGDGKQKLIDTLKKELFKRISQQKSGSANAYIKLMSIEGKKDDVELEAFVNQKTLKSIIKSLIDKETKFRKFNGSNLVQAPVTGMESTTFGKENISLDQTGYLKTYRFGAEVNKAEIADLEKQKEKELSAAKSSAKKKEISQLYDSQIAELKGTTMAEIMVTFTPEWEYLLSLEYDGNEIGSLENLNNILRTDKQWVKENKNRLSMLAVRIPIQDPNSIEGFIIKEFLPMSAGAKIVVPSEIVAKSGGDFDIDKLMVYYYNANKETGELPFDNTAQGLENKIVKGYLDLLLLPEMFYKLVTANSISVLKDESKEDDDNTLGTQVVDVLNYYIGQNILTYDNTDLRMPLFNVKQKTILQIAKKLLGHAATIRSNFEELKHAGLLLATDYDVVIRKYLDKKEIALIKNPKLIKSIMKDTGRKESKIRFPFIMPDGNLAYNTTADNKINVSESFNKDNVSITEIISAIMNGLVDVASKPWIVIFSMNEELTSYNFLMLLSGVPANIVFKVNNQKIIKDYIGNKLELKQSLYKRALTSSRSQKTNRLLVDTFNNIIDDFTVFRNNRKVLDPNKLNKLKEVFKKLGVNEKNSKFILDYLDTYILTDKNKEQRTVNQIIFKTNIESFLFDLQNNLKESQFLSDGDLTNTLGQSYNEMSVNDLANQIKLLASTIFMKPVGEGLTKALEAIDYDKSQSEYIHDEYIKQTSLSSIKRQGFFDKESFTNLQNLHIAAPYNLSNLTKASASIVAPLTESKEINKYAIALSKLLSSNNYINPDKKDSVITSFKTDFINYIVQNYGTIDEYDTDGNISEKTNIVEYAVKNGIFVDKKIMSSSGREYTSNKLEDKSLPNQLFTLLKTFDKFNQFNVFSNYLIPAKGKKIENENEEDDANLDFIYKIGRIFKNLSPSELDDYNKEMKLFAAIPFTQKDILYAIENNSSEILEQFISSDTISFEEVIDELNKIKSSLELVSFADIKDKVLKEKLENPEMLKLIKDFKINANNIKQKVAELLPYLSLLQSTASYSSFSISNLFINDNYNITKEAIKNVKGSIDITDKKSIVELLKSFTVPFLLNNIRLLRTDKKNQLLKIIAGKDQESGKGNDFSKNTIINNASYFTNYYDKEFSINDTDADFSNAPTILDSISKTGISDSFIFDFLKLKSSKILNDKDTIEDVEIDLFEEESNPEENIKEEEDELTGYENEFVDYEGAEEDEQFNHVTLQNGNSYVVDPNTEEVRDLNNKIKKGKVKYEVLVNYYSNMDQLEMASTDKESYYIVGNKIITKTFSIVDNLKQEDRDTILEKALPHTINPC